MGSSSPVAQHHQHQEPQSGLPTQQQNSRGFATLQPSKMDSTSTKEKAVITSVYPSPADDPINTFEAPFSPLFKDVHENPMTSPRLNNVTLPPLRSVVQMPSPSSSPQMPVATHKSISDEYFRSPASPDNRMKDAPLFRDRSVSLSHPSNFGSLFPIPSFPVADQTNRQSSSTATSTSGNQTSPPTKRKRKSIPVRAAPPLAPGAEMYGTGHFWSRIAKAPEHYYPLMRDTAQSSPSKQTPQQENSNATAQKSTQKRPADSPLESSPPKRRQVAKNEFKVPNAPRPSASPRDVPLDAPARKRVRRPSEATKAKAARAPSEKVERDYMLYPDYCPLLSTLDSDDVTFPNVDWKAAPQDLHNHPDRNLLHPKELAVASKLVLSCSVYLYIKRRFFAARYRYALRDQKFNINAAQIACKGLDEHGITGIDVNKTSRLHKAFDKVGWLDKKHMERFM